MKPFGFSLVLAGLFGAVSFGSPAMSGPIAGLPTSQLNSMSTMPEEAQAGSHIVQVRFGRGGGGHRGGGMHRHHGVYRGGVAYRRGAVVRRGAVSVRDFVRHTTLTIQAGHTYLAKAPGA